MLVFLFFFICIFIGLLVDNFVNGVVIGNEFREVFVVDDVNFFVLFFKKFVFRMFLDSELGFLEKLMVGNRFFFMYV